MEGEVRVGHYGVEGFVGFVENASGELTEGFDRVARDADVLDGALGIAYPAEFFDGCDDFVLGNEFDVMAVDDVEIARLETLKTSTNATPDPLWRVVEFVIGYAADFCEEKVLLARVVTSCLFGLESFAKKCFGGTIVG